jgi:hypothetical protein
MCQIVIVDVTICFDYCTFDEKEVHVINNLDDNQVAFVTMS